MAKVTWRLAAAAGVLLMLAQTWLVAGTGDALGQPSGQRYVTGTPARFFCTTTPVPPGATLPTWTPEPTRGPGTPEPTATPRYVVVPNHYQVVVRLGILDPGIPELVRQVALDYDLPIFYANPVFPDFTTDLNPAQVDVVGADPRVLAVGPVWANPLPGEVHC